MIEEEIHNSLLSALEPLEREIMCMRYGLEGHDRRSLDEIGRVFECPKERARQIEARALRKLRRKPQTFHKNLKEFIKPSKPEREPRKSERVHTCLRRPAAPRQARSLCL